MGKIMVLVWVLQLARRSRQVMNEQLRETRVVSDLRRVTVQYRVISVTFSSFFVRGISRGEL